MKDEYRKADYIFHNGKVVTVNARDEIAAAVAVSDNRILYVGGNEGAKQYATAETEWIDLSGMTLLPGFIDAHAHMAVTGMSKSVFVDLDPAKAPDMETLLCRIKAAAEKTPAGQWIVCWGYDELRMAERRHPAREDLDRAAPDHPVLAARCDGHTGAFNSRALAIAGMDEKAAEAYSPLEVMREGGRINGVCSDNAYYYMWNFVELDLEDVIYGLAVQSGENLRAGVTSVHDAGGFGRITNRAYLEAVKRGAVKCRVAPLSFNMLGADNYLANFHRYIDLGFGSYLGNERLKFGLMKIMLDGSSSAPACAVKEPYCHKKEDYGTVSLPVSTVEEAAMEAQKNGLQITAHAVGDRAIDCWLTALEKAQAAYPRDDSRHRIEHCAIVDADMIARIKALGAIPVINPRFLHLNGERYWEFFGDRAGGMFPARSFLEAGVVCAVGTDNPIIAENPLLGLSSLICRRSALGTPVGKEQEVDILAAIRMYTYNNAYSVFEEDRLGSIEPGKLADLTVFNGDVPGASAEELESFRCVLTMVDGEIVYREGL